jgi:hypothetical protein
MMQLVCTTFADPSAIAYFLRPQHKDVLASCNDILSAFFPIKDHEFAQLLGHLTSILLHVGGIVYDHLPHCRAPSARPSLHKYFLNETVLLKDPNLMIWKSLVDFFASLTTDPNVLRLAAQSLLKILVVRFASVLDVAGCTVVLVHASRDPGDVKMGWGTDLYVGSFGHLGADTAFRA